MRRVRVALAATSPVPEVPFVAQITIEGICDADQRSIADGSRRLMWLLPEQRPHLITSQSSINPHPQAQTFALFAKTLMLAVCPSCPLFLETSPFANAAAVDK